MKIKNLILVALILLLGAAAAQAVVVPAKSVINTVRNVVYVPDNDSTPGIRIYQHASPPSEYWSENTSKRINLEAKSYGLAVWHESTTSYGRMLISVSNGTSSKLRYYQLDYNGLPTGSPKDVDINAPGSSPMGVAILPSGDRAYLADAGTGRVYYFKYDSSSDSWTQVSYVVTAYNIYDVAVTTPVETYTWQYAPFPPPGRFTRVLSSSKYNIFVSVRGSAGKILILDYNYTPSSGEVISASGEVAGIGYPTNLKLNGDETRLYAAVNGSSGGDIKVYDIVSGSTPILQNVKTVSSIAGKYGWTGFDVSLNENYLFFSQVQNSSENSTKFYYVPLPLTGDVTVNDTDNLLKSRAKNFDGLVVNPGYQYLGGTYSGDGSLDVMLIGETIHNTQPGLSTDLKQYLLDGTTEIPVGGTTHENRIKVKFRVWDPDPGDLITPTVRWATPPGVGGTTGSVTGPAVTSGTTVEITIPAGTFANGNYGWDISTRDLAGAAGPVTACGDSDINVDFVVDYVPPPDTTAPGAVTNLVASPGTSAGQVDLTWRAPGDDGMSGTVSGYQVRYATSNTPLANPFTDENFATTGTLYAPNLTAPFVAGGGTENRTLSGLPYDPTQPTYIWIAIKAFDDATPTPNVGPLGVTSTSETLVRDHIPAPVVTRVYPNRAPNTGATNIVIEGENFIGGAIVNLQTTPATTLTINSLALSRIEAVVPSGLTPGTYHITVSTGGGVSATSSADEFTVMSGPETPPVASQVIDFRTAPGNGQVTLLWTNPADTDMAEITVRRAGPFAPPVDPVNYPASPTAGTAVYGSGIIPAPGEAITTTDTGLTNGQVYYYVVYIRDTSGNWSVLDYDTAGGQNAAAGLPSESAGTASKVFTIAYLSETQAENWISVPYTSATVSGSPINTIGDLMNSLAVFTPQAGDILTLSWYDNATQTPYSIMRDTPDGVTWNPWDPETESQSVITGKTYILSISNSAGRPTFTNTWEIAGTVPAPGSVTFDIVYQSETQAENWISTPNSTGLAIKGDIMASLTGRFTPQTGDIVTLSWYDNATQTPYQAMRDTADGTTWNPWDPEREAEATTLGDPYKVTISNSSGRPTITTTWP